MIVTFGNRCCRNLILGCVMLSLSGCYYMQAARGQLDVMSKREPIDELIRAPDTPEELAGRLQLVSEARQFAIDNLLLPDNDSYRSYADLGRDYVVWNVFAAPEFSLQPKTWCFPIAGCVAYRGYFSEDAARRKADQLREDGLDVAVGGIPAYSTLGRFADPVLNTMMHWDDADLVATIFHELAHQVLYVKDDSTFNESFATTVEEIGIERWLTGRDQGGDFGDYINRREQRKQTMEVIAAARSDLEKIYASSMAAHEMRRAKETRLARLANELPAEFQTDLNNARLASIGLYQSLVPEFRALYEECERDMRCFFDRASSVQPAESSMSH
jgi:predicted aminopeptidase